MARVAWLFLVSVMTFVVVIGMGNLEGQETPMGIEVRDVEVTQSADGLPNPDDLIVLVDFNRDAAAQVALIGLAPTERRADVARAAAAWLGQWRGILPDVDGYTARQRAILADWQRALIDYADGQSGSLARVQAVSEANSKLFGEMVTHITFGREMEDDGD
jgi:hypothetical protein